MLGLYFLHGATWMDEWVVAHVQGGKLFACESDDPIIELVMTSRDEAALLVTQGVTYIEFRIASVTVGREVWGFYSVA